METETEKEMIISGLFCFLNVNFMFSSPTIGTSKEMLDNMSHRNLCVHRLITRQNN